MACAGFIFPHWCSLSGRSVAHRAFTSSTHSGSKRFFMEMLGPHFKNALTACPRNQPSIVRSRFHESALRFRRSASGAPSGISRSTSPCVLSHTGTALASSSCPSLVSCKMRLRRSPGSGEIFTSPRRSNGFNAAVNVVRSIASREATGPIGGGMGRLSDIKRENCPLVSPNGRNASSNRRASERAARCT